MNVNHPLALRRSPEARAIFGNLSTSTWHEWVAKGLMVTPVSIGARSVAYPDHELQAIAAARIAGKSDVEIKQIVRDLIAARAQAGKAAA